MASAPDGSIGTAHPTTIEKVAEDGSWIVACQAREDTDGDGKTWVGVGMHGSVRGDRLDPYVILGSGAGTRVDAYVDSSEHHLVVIRNGALELVDTQAKKHVVLAGADLRDDGSPYENPRAASIAANGSRLVYLRHDGKHDSVVVRDITTGAERTVPVDGVLWRAGVDASGRWAMLRVMTSDTDGDGAISWPVARTSLARRGCRGRVGSFTSGADGGDRPSYRWLDLETGALVDDPTARRAIGDVLLRIAKDGAVSLGTDVIADASCNARLLAAVSSPPRLLYTCGKKSDDDDAKAQLVVAGPGFKKQTAMTVPRGDNSRIQTVRGFFCWDACIDVATGAPVALPRGGIEHRHGDRLVLVNAGKRVVYDLATKTSTPLPATGDYQGGDGALLAIGNDIFDVTRAVKVADLSMGRPLGHANGRILVGNDAPLDCSKDPAGLPHACGNPAAGGAFGMPTGPLRWK